MIRADGHTASRPTALFFARVKPELLSLLEFYQQDIATLRSLGFDIRVETRLWPATLGSDSICFAWWWATAVPVVLARRFRRMPTIVTGATEFPETPLVKRWVKGLLTAIASRMADANIAISDFELDRLRSYHPRRLRRIYPSIDHEFYRPGRKSDSPSAAIVAQLNPISIKRKGVDLAIAAARLVNDKVPEFTLHIIGPVTTEGAQLLDMLVAKARAGSVVIHGEVDRETKRRLLQSSWFYLQPSTMEGFGMAVAEAMACAAVPVCSDRGSLPELVSDGGIVCRERTAEAVAAALSHLIGNPDERLRLATLARKRVVIAFDPDTRVQTLRLLLSDIGVLPVRSR